MIVSRDRGVIGVEVPIAVVIVILPVLSLLVPLIGKIPDGELVRIIGPASVGPKIGPELAPSCLDRETSSPSSAAEPVTSASGALVRASSALRPDVASSSALVTLDVGIVGPISSASSLVDH